MYGSGRDMLGVRGLCLNFTNHEGIGEKCDMYLCFGCGGVWGVRGQLRTGSRMVVCLL